MAATGLVLRYSHQVPPLAKPVIASHAVPCHDSWSTDRSYPKRYPVTLALLIPCVPFIIFVDVGRLLDTLPP
ncbi:hypothetical protein P691DRAFT_807844 [Macrolepiota fuliginosa MF-IS2]|uniref:Uncharacterized protein n=1 Tax=Macrolepiota fuliginosa MF-IS2 TaxID=1400762 RepID=A0A9P5X3H7_9AGAR|nr:hypothetical protein P691DRAFT_807844 [Macrolepiota fuliginosa MF-IS2]